MMRFERGLTHMRKGYARCLATAALLCLAVTAPHGAVVAAPAVKAVALETQAAGLQLVIGFDGAFAAPSLFALGQPNRIVIDLPGATVAAGTITGALSLKKTGSGTLTLNGISTATGAPANSSPGLPV